MKEENWRSFLVEDTGSRLRVRTRMLSRIEAGLGRAVLVGGGLALALLVVMVPDLVHDVGAAPGRWAFRVGGAIGAGGVVALALLVARGLPDRRWEIDRVRRVLVLWEPGAFGGAEFEIPLADVDEVMVRSRSGGHEVVACLHGGTALPLGLPVRNPGEVERLSALVRAQLCAG